MAKFAELSGNPEQWAWLAVVKALPFAMLGLPIGYLTDRHDRKTQVMISDFGRFWLYLGMAFCHDLTLFYLLVFLSSVCEACFMPAYRSLVHATLDRESLLSANSLEETLRSIVQILGIGISGMLLGWVGVTACILIDAATFLVSSTNIALIRDLPRRSEAARAAAPSMSFREELTQGLRVISGTPGLRLPVVVWTVLLLLIAYEAPLFFPLIVEKGWGGATETGYLFATLCIGSFFSSLTLLGRRESYLSTSRAVGLMILVDGCVLLSAVHVASYALSLTFILFLGVTETVFRSYAVTEIQRRSPPEAVGRVFAACSMVHEPLQVLAMMLAGTVTAVASAQVGLYSAFGLELVLGLLILLLPIVEKSSTEA